MGSSALDPRIVRCAFKVPGDSCRRSRRARWRRFLNRKCRAADAEGVAKGGRKTRTGGAGGDLAPRLERVFAAILEQVRQDPAFAQRIASALAEAAPAAPPASEPPRRVASPAAPTSSRLPPAPPAPPKRKKALIDPFALYETGWEAMLRSHLERLDIEQLRDVIHQYKMDSAGRTASISDLEEMRSWIIRACENFGMS